jgi:elongation factor 1-alpha
MATFYLQEIYNILGIGTVIVGKVIEGVLREHMKCNLEGHVCEIRAMETHHESIKEAKEGSNVGVTVTGDITSIKNYKGRNIEFY